MSLQLRHVSTIGKKLVKQQYLLHMFSQYGELRPTRGWNRSGSLGHPCKFERGSRLGIVTSRHSSIGRQSNFAALNRGRHLYLAGRPSRWALAPILVNLTLCRRIRVWSTETATTTAKLIHGIRLNAATQRTIPPHGQELYLLRVQQPQLHLPELHLHLHLVNFSVICHLISQF